MQALLLHLRYICSPPEPQCRRQSSSAKYIQQTQLQIPLPLVKFNLSCTIARRNWVNDMGVYDHIASLCLIFVAHVLSMLQPHHRLQQRVVFHSSNPGCLGIEIDFADFVLRRCSVGLLYHSMRWHQAQRNLMFHSSSCELQSWQLQWQNVTCCSGR